MPAGLIAFPPDIDLQRLQTPSLESQLVPGERLFKAIHNG
jgi:hypothetical protein